MAAKKKQAKFADAYIVVTGCNTSDGTRYEIGDDYFPGNHKEADTAALLRLKAIKENV